MKSLNKTINLKLKVIKYIMLLSFLVIILMLFKTMIIDRDKYLALLEIKTGKIYKGEEAPRGNIYDRFGVLLVGNKEIPIIKYEKNNKTTETELELVEVISENIDINYESVKEEDIINYLYERDYVKLLDKISDKIKEKHKKRIINSNDFEEIMKAKINLKDISETEKKNAYIYKLMNDGYKYESKVIKSVGVTQKEIEFINSIDNFYIAYRYERTYPEGDTLRSILGNIGYIREKDINEYLEKGYFRNDMVGISYLEEEYEEYLKGTPERYKVSSNGEKIILNEAIKGDDLYLTIDINLQKEVEKIVEEEMIKAKKEPNTEYFNKVYAVIGDANNGSVYAFVGKEILYNGNYKFVDNSLGLITDAIAPGSSVKAASHIVGYETGVITEGYEVVDSCIKIKNVDEKCSWKSLGSIDDIKALKYSSNYYQYLMAIKIGKGSYRYNANLKLDKSGFDVYRKIYNSFGLGIKTGIDLPNESLGFKGSDEYTLSLLDFPIGQYDNYTPIQMFQYISTINNNGTRVAPHLGKTIQINDEVITIKRKVVGGVNAKEKHFERVKLGLKEVMITGGTGKGYIDLKYNPIGKTGTASTFIDTNNNGKVDTETTSKVFVGIAKNISLVVISPNVSSNKTSYTSSVNKRITKKISDVYFEKYSNNIIGEV